MRSTTSKLYSVGDFDLGRTIGKGRFARVRLAKLQELPVLPICLKILKKRDMARMDQEAHIIAEKEVLSTAQHPFIIRMLATFQDPVRLYMVLELVNGGELFQLLRAESRFKINQARFYIAEVTSALCYLHGMLIVYRDLKPENILIHRSGHIKLTDFGFAKYLKGQKTYTLCGTPAYMAPEVVRQVGHGLAVDWWGVGILLYELLAGRTPFIAMEEHQMFSQIVGGRVQYPPAMDKLARDLVQRLLIPDPMRRLGCPEAMENAQQTIASIKDHRFFKPFKWEDIDNGKMAAPWKPKTNNSETDVSRFEFFEESDTTLNGQVDSMTASQFLAEDGVGEDTYATWTERTGFKEEALAMARDIVGAREEKARAREKEKEEAELRGAAQVPVPEAAVEVSTVPECATQDAPKENAKVGCCAVQ